MTVPLDTTTYNGFFDWIFHTLDVNLFGAVGIMMLFLIILVFALLMYFNANKFVVFGFMASLLLAFGIYGYSIIGWIAPVGAMLAGLLLGLAFIKLIGI